MIIFAAHIMRQDFVQDRTCERMISSIMTINLPLVLSEYLESVIKLLTVVNSVVLHVKNRNLTAKKKKELKAYYESLWHEQTLRLLRNHFHIVNIPVTSIV